MDDEVFGNEYAAAYDLIYGDKDYEAECGLIQTALRRFGNNDVRALLDMGCGTGNHSLRLAATGLEVVGVDLSAHMLDQSRVKAAAQGLGVSRVDFRQGDIATIDVGRIFDAAIMMFAV